MITTPLMSNLVSDERGVVNSIDVSTLGLREVGKEYRTELGYIDILTVDANDSPVPIEVKFGEATDKAVGQILGYMKAVGSKHGMIIAAGFSKRVKAVCEDLNITLVMYTYSKDTPRWLGDLTVSGVYQYHLPNQRRSVIDDIHAYISKFGYVGFHGKQTGMRCTKFKRFDTMCDIIADIENVFSWDVYMAFRSIGIKHRRDELQSGRIDQLEKMGTLLQLFSDPYLITSAGIFPPVGDKQYKITNEFYQIDSSKIAPAKRAAKHYGIQIGEYNLFNALIGLEILANDNSKIKKCWIFDDIHCLFRKAIIRIEQKNKTLHCLLNDDA